FVAFGGVPVKNGQIDSGGLGVHAQKPGLRKAAAAGVEFVNVSPLRSDMMEELGAEWLPARPNTDAAIMLALAHTLHVEGLADEAFMARYCVGFDRFLAYLTGAEDGAPKDAEWAASITEIGAEAIRGLARRMAAKRTMISVSWSLTRQDHGEQPFWAAIALAAMLGQIGLPGGGFGFGYSAANSIGANFAPMPAASLPQGANGVAAFIPVARIADMLENPGGAFDFDGRRLTYPDIRLIWWAGGNPYHHHQDLNRLAKAWEKPETIVVNDWCWTATARRADVVLPCATHLERGDLSASARDPYLIATEKAAEAPAGVRTDHAIFSGIARRLGFEDAFTEGRSEEEWLRWIYDMTRQRAGEAGIETPGWDALREKGWHRTPEPERPRVMLEAFRADPDANPLKTPSGRIEIFSETVAGFSYDDCPGHPVWREPAEWLGAAGAHPLHLISNQPERKLHSQLDQGAYCAAGKRKSREPITLNPADAAARGIAEGDVVRVFNDRGVCLGAAELSDELRPGVARMSTGAWWDPDESGMCRHGNPNAVTRDAGTSRLGQGPTAHSCLVEVERFDGEPPAVRAFDPPEIKPRGAVRPPP
ncbi:MAG: molybdopterin-dependent oxidoreductase, partial [Pseudomonadota bacterium]